MHTVTFYIHDTVGIGNFMYRRVYQANSVSNSGFKPADYDGACVPSDDV